MLTRFHFVQLLLIVDAAAGKRVCQYQDVLNHLNMTRGNDLLQLTRPVVDHTHVTVIELDLILYALLGVIEKTQTFIPFIWVSVKWHSEHISWDPAQFCGITSVAVPKDVLWRPDLFIYEMIQKDESPQNSYMFVSHKGQIISEEDINVVSTCKMDVYKFPFDTQKCNITIGSAIYSVDEVQMVPMSNSSRATQFSREMMRTQGEWEFHDLSVARFNLTYHDIQWDQLIYTFTIKRRPFLHIINFLLPILFFLSLDLASFFISDCRGEKLSFKVTVLLAISVLLLILNDILPCMSNNTPLIATYCIVIFALMLLSLLETILVTYLMDRASASKEKLSAKADGAVKGEKHNSRDYYAGDSQHSVTGPEEKTWTHCSFIGKESSGEKDQEMLPVTEEFQVNRRLQLRESQVLLLILDELRALQKTMTLHLTPREGAIRPAHWARTINKVFFFFYVTTVVLFLSLIFYQWTS